MRRNEALGVSGWIIRSFSSWLVVLCLLGLGCDRRDNPAVLFDGDPVLYENTIQPVVDRNCAFLGCHGRETVPLVLYSVTGIRLRDPAGLIDFTRPPLDERALSPAELEHNRRAIASRIGPSDPKGDLFLRRLIPPKDGGIPHADVVVFLRSSHPDIEALRRFLETVHAR